MQPDLLAAYIHFLPPPLRAISWRIHPLDGKLLLFDRETGLNILLDGDETRHLQRIAPRTLLIAVTNACNLTCGFCYRDLQSRSLWQYDSLLEFCQQADEWGVLEVAFGGGEPLLFPRWAEFINELYATTRLSINFTTNGTLLDEQFLNRIAGKYGQIRVSLYEDNNWHDTVKLLSDHNTRFGVNWLITPAEIPTLEARFMELLMLGVRDLLLISYKGNDVPRHMTLYQQLGDFVNKMHQQFGQLVTLKLDACWGDTMPQIPRLFVEDDCNAGDAYLSITSDKRVKPCSFHHLGMPFETLDDVRNIWQRIRISRQAAQIAGCARLPQRGVKGDNHALIDLASIRQQPQQ